MQGAVDMIRKVILRRLEMTLCDNLLWGIPNEITLKYIAATLPFSAWKKAATLSADWERAFQGGLVYNTRVLSQATQEFLLVLCYFYTDIPDDVCISKTTLSLFSPSEWEWFKFPPIPSCHEGIFHYYQYALLDSSIYLLGGTRTRNRCDGPSAEVVVLDLARHPLEWRRCASMRVSRHNFEVCVMQGKVFAFGGIASSGELEIRNEVYDPEVDAWSFIAPTTPLASISRAFPVGQKFFVCIGDRARGLGSWGWPFFNEYNVDTKFVVKIGENGPKIRKTSDVDEHDDIDGLHKIIEDNFAFDIPFKHSGTSPTESVASRLGGEFCGFYYPANDEWRDFDMEILNTYKVDEFRPAQMYILREDDDGMSETDTYGWGPYEPEPRDFVSAEVWSMRF